MLLFLLNNSGVNSGNCPTLCDFLSRPSLPLPAYAGSGAGGAGQHKIQLNQCIRDVKERIAVIRGVLLLQARAQNWPALQY